jgi:hypothetical protein
LTKLEIAKACEKDPDFLRMLNCTYQRRSTEAESKLQLYFKCKLELYIELDVSFGELGSVYVVISDLR